MPLQPFVAPRALHPSPVFTPHIAAASGQEAARDPTAEARQRLALAAAHLWDDPAGRLVIEHLLDVSLRATPYPFGQPLPAEMAAAWGQYHHGKCDLVAHLLRLVAEGRGEAPPRHDNPTMTPPEEQP